MKSLELATITVLPPKYSDLVEAKNKFKQLQLVWLNSYFSTGDLVASAEVRTVMKDLLDLFQVEGDEDVKPNFEKIFTSPELIEECFLSLSKPTEGWVKYSSVGDDGVPTGIEWDFANFLNDVRCPKLMDLCGYRNVKKLIIEAINAASKEKVATE